MELVKLIEITGRIICITMTVLQTQRLLIRELAPSDGSAILCFANDQSIKWVFELCFDRL